ncbi:hypothetical protein [Candidatus Similichlamydia laticola]|nr:hypothetical protein [Candidatus Similichlamydia laticola]
MAVFVHCRFIRALCRLLCFFSLCVCALSLWGPSRFFGGPEDLWKEDQAESENGLPSREVSLSVLPSLGLGQAGSGWVEVPDLRGQFSFVSLDSRPDLPQEKTDEFYIYLTKSKKVIKAFMDVDYSFLMQGSALLPAKEFGPDTIKVRFTREKGEIWVRFSFMSQNNAFAELEKDDLFFPLSLVRVQDKEASGFDVQYLSSIGFQWAGKDTLLEQSTGAVQQYIGLFRGKGVPEKSLHLEVGDCLFKEEEEWVVAPPGERTRGRIIFQLEEVTDSRLLFSVWDLQGRVKRGLYLPRVQEGLDLAVVRELRLSAVRSAEHVILQLKQQRLSVHLGDYLVIQYLSPDRSSFRVVQQDELGELGHYVWIKWIGRIEGKWQVEVHVYSELRSKFVSCLISENSFSYKNVGHDPKQSVSRAYYLEGENLRFAAFRDA